MDPFSCQLGEFGARTLQVGQLTIVFERVFHKNIIFHAWMECNDQTMMAPIQPLSIFLQSMSIAHYGPIFMSTK